MKKNTVASFKGNFNLQARRGNFSVFLQRKEYLLKYLARKEEKKMNSGY